MTLTRLPGSKWWIETSDTTFEITATYNKYVIGQDILALNATLAQYPDPVQEAKDVLSLKAAIANSGIAEAAKTRITALINRMYSAYGIDPESVRVADLVARRDALVEIYTRLV